MAPNEPVPSAMVEWPDEERADLARTMKRRRDVALAAGAALLLLVTLRPIATWPQERIALAFYVYNAGWAVVLLLACFFWAALFRWARAAGGASYARGYVFLSVLLMPFLLAGFYVVPAAVERDIATGVAEWRRAHVTPPGESARRTVLFLACLALTLPLGWIAPELYVLAPLVAFFLQRLALPWVLAPSAERDGAA